MTTQMMMTFGFWTAFLKQSPQEEEAQMKVEKAKVTKNLKKFKTENLSNFFNLFKYLASAHKQFQLSQI